MAPKVGTSSIQKQALCVQWIQRSGVAHTLKDLEKALPQVASINGMAVKDYIQAMTDENMIRVEKIGSGNWYWSFLSDEKLAKELALAKAEIENANSKASVEVLRREVVEAAALRQDDGDEMLMEPGMSRAAMTETHGELDRVLEVLTTELTTFSSNDPVEVDRQRANISLGHRRVEMFTDAICGMEGWFKHRIGGDKAVLIGIKRGLYGEEFDEATGGLRDL